jgi:hypothetical protein
MSFVSPIIRSLRHGASNTYASLQKCNKCIFRMGEGIVGIFRKSKAQLMGLNVGTLRVMPKARPQQIRFSTPQYLIPIQPAWAA